MNALYHSILLQIKLDLRNRHILTSYYLLPIAFYLIIGAIYKEITPGYESTMLTSMSILAISLASYLGTPAPIVDFFNSNAKKTYQIGNIKLSIVLLTTFFSAVAHMCIVSSVIYMSIEGIFGVVPTSDIGTHFAWLILCMVISTTIGIIIGLVSKSTSVMTMISQLAFLPTMLLSGILLPLSFLPKILQEIGKILPATYAVKIMNTSSNPESQLVLTFLMLGILSICILLTVYKRQLISE